MDGLMPLKHDSLQQVIADNVLRLRKSFGWSQKQLASRAGLSQRVISNTEISGSISVSTLAGLSKAFGLPVTLLVATNIPLDKVRRDRTVDMMKMFDSLSDYSQQRLLEIAQDYQSIDDPDSAP